MDPKQDIKGTTSFGRAVDFGKVASDYRKFRPEFPWSFFRYLDSRGWVERKQRALDLGTGTGTVARGLAQLGLQVRGIDPASELLAEAAALDEEAGVTVDYCVARAEALNEPDASFDVVTAGQCWHWLERSKAASEVSRVLKPGGRVIIAHFDWVPLAGNVVEATERLIHAANPAWTLGGGTGIYPQWLTDLALSRFGHLETFSFDHDQPYSHESWRGRIRASAAIKASLSHEEVECFDRQLAETLRTRFPENPFHVPHRVWAVTGIKG